MKLDRKRAAQQRRIANALSEIGLALPGSLTVRAYRCGKTKCRCRAEPPQLHGPYAFWTRKVNGKTVTRMLSHDEVAEYQPLFDNARKLRDLASELQQLTLQLVEEAHDSPRRKAANTSPRAPHARTRQKPNNAQAR